MIFENSIWSQKVWWYSHRQLWSKIWFCAPYKIGSNKGVHKRQCCENVAYSFTGKGSNTKVLNGQSAGQLSTFWSAVQNNQNKWQPRTKIAATMTVIKNTVTMKTATTNTTTMKTQEREASSWMVNSWFTLDISCLNDFNWSLNNHHNLA